MDKIIAKDWLISHWSKYNIKSIRTESEFRGLLNILQSRNLTLDDMYRCVQNGEREFMTFWNAEGWTTMDELYQAVLEYNTFYTEQEFIDWMLEIQEELKYEGNPDPAAEIKSWTYAKNWIYNKYPVDTMIIKTEDGYVRQITY